MNFYQKILKRFSVREYDIEKPISDNDYQKIIDVIKIAPTSSNWHSSSVIAIRDRQILNKLAQTSKYAGVLKTCSVFFVFLADFNRMNLIKEKYPEYEYNSHSTESYTTAVGEAFIQATMTQDIAISLGLGTGFLGLVRSLQKEIIDILNIKGQAFPVVGLSIGYPLIDKNPQPKLNRVYENEYNIDILENEMNEYSKELKEYFAKLFPEKKPHIFEENVIKSAHYTKTNTKIIEDIWQLELDKNE